GSRADNRGEPGSHPDLLSTAVRRHRRSRRHNGYRSEEAFAGAFKRVVVPWAVRRSAAAGATTPGRPSNRPASPVLGSHSSGRGRYQFQSPSSFIEAGSSTARTMVASISTAAARPTPACLTSSAVSVPKIENTPTITSAALVTTPAVRVIP